MVAPQLRETGSGVTGGVGGMTVPDEVRASVSPVIGVKGGAFSLRERREAAGRSETFRRQEVLGGAELSASDRAFIEGRLDGGGGTQEQRAAQMRDRLRGIKSQRDLVEGDGKGLSAMDRARKDQQDAAGRRPTKAADKAEPGDGEAVDYQAFAKTDARRAEAKYKAAYEAGEGNHLEAAQWRETASEYGRQSSLLAAQAGDGDRASQRLLDRNDDVRAFMQAERAGSGDASEIANTGAQSRVTRGRAAGEAETDLVRLATAERPEQQGSGGMTMAERRRASQPSIFGDRSEPMAKGAGAMGRREGGRTDGDRPPVAGGGGGMSMADAQRYIAMMGAQHRPMVRGA